MKPFRILARERILWEKFYKVERQRVELPDGSEGDWFVKINNDAVIVVPINAKGEVLLQKNYKHGCGEEIIEFCAGMIDDGETWEQAADRELREETGCQGKHYVKMGEIFANPTSSAMRYHLILAQEIEKIGASEQESAEQVEPFWVKSLEEAEKILTSGKSMTSSATISALHLAMKQMKA